MVSKRQQQAVECFRNSYNCSQAVLTSLAPLLRLDNEVAFKIACGFGGGMGKLQNTCGTVTGAIMVLGLKYGKYWRDDEQAKDDTYDAVKRFVEEFKAKHQTIICRELITYDLNDEEELNKAKEEKVFERICEKCIQDSVAILEKMLKND